MEIYKKTYSNGMRLVAVHTDTAFAEYAVFFLAGQQYQKDKDSGVAHFLEHLLCGSTKNKTKKEIVEIEKSKGASTNAFTDYNELGFTGTCFSCDLHEMLDLQFERIFEPKLANDEFESERKIILEELFMRQSRMKTPDYKHWLGIKKLLFPGAPIDEIVGTKTKLENLTIEDLVAHKQRLLTPNNMTICVVGGVDIGALDAYLSKKFDQTKNTPVEFAHKKRKVLPARKTLVTKSNENSIGIYFHIPTDRKKPAECAKAYIFSKMLRSLLFDKVREESNLVYHIGTSIESHMDTFYLKINFFSTTPKKVFDVICKQLDEISKNGVEQKYLVFGNAKTRKEHATFLESKKPFSEMRIINGEILKISYPIDETEKFFQSALETTNDHMKQMAKLLLDSKRIVVATKSKTIQKSELEQFFDCLDETKRQN